MCNRASAYLDARTASWEITGRLPDGRLIRTLARNGLRVPEADFWTGVVEVCTSPDRNQCLSEPQAAQKELSGSLARGTGK